jgi:hypothetical protein
LNLSGTIGFTDTGDSTQSHLTYGGTIYQGGQVAIVHPSSAARRDASRSTLLISQGVNQNVGNAWRVLRVVRATSEASSLSSRCAHSLRGVRKRQYWARCTTLMC